MAPTTWLPRFRALTTTTRPAPPRRTTAADDAVDKSGDDGGSRPPDVPAGAVRGAAPAGPVTEPASPAWSRREQERLARDLHDLALTRLSRLGFELSGVSNLVGGRALATIMAAVADLDDLIVDLRRFALGRLEGSAGPGGLRQDVRAIVEEAAARTGCTATLSVDGDLDVLPECVAHHLRAVVAEAVHNVVVHSRGSCLQVAVTVGSDRVEATVVDDGVGPPERPVYGLGLGSMAARARELRGTFSFAPGPCGGATVSWCVPLPSGSTG